MSRLGSLDWLEEHLSRGLRTIPFGGAALAVATGDEIRMVVLGEASPGRPVDTATPFHVCSCAKMFTAAVISRLVIEGALEWDQPVRGELPEFAFADPQITSQCTFRDLAALRVGLTREGVAEWGFRQDASKSERLARVRHMGLVAPFRDRFSYSNLCYIALSLAAERLSGRTYSELFDETIGAPLGLRDSWSEGFGVSPRSPPATPYMPVDGVPRPVRELTGPNSEGSARVHLSVRDAALWLKFLLSAAAGSDAGPLPATAVKAMMSPQTPIHDPDLRLAPYGGGLGAYGFGLSLTELRGRRIVRHGGGGRGWRHAMVLAPEARAGVMLMVSAETPRIEGLALEILDRLTGGTGQFADAFEAAAQAAAGLLQRATQAAFPILDTPPAAPLPGVYANPVTGAVRLLGEAGDLRFEPLDAPIFTGRLASLGGDLHEVRFDEPALSPQPLDPRFWIKAAGADVLDTTYWGQLRRVG